MRKPTFWFPTWSDTNQAVQLPKMVRGLKFPIQKVEGLHYVAKTKALISFAVTAKLNCVFVFAYAKCLLSHDAAQLLLPLKYSRKLKILKKNFLELFCDAVQYLITPCFTTISKLD